MGYIVTAKDENGQVYTAVYNRRPLRLVKRDMRKGLVKTEDGKRLIFVDAVDAGLYHVCKYCKGIADGPDEDILCPKCQELFGHERFSEL